LLTLLFISLQSLFVARRSRRVVARKRATALPGDGGLAAEPAGQ
jgi:hypothetical protein